MCFIIGLSVDGRFRYNLAALPVLRINIRKFFFYTLLINDFMKCPDNGFLKLGSAIF